MEQPSHITMTFAVDHLRPLIEATVSEAIRQMQPTMRSHDIPADPERRLLTKRDAPAYLSMSVRRLDDVLKSGEIPVIRDGGIVRVDQQDLDCWIDSKKANSPRDPGIASAPIQ